MKPLFFSLLTLAAAVPLASAALPDPVTVNSPKVTVVFQHPDKFRDIRDMNMPTDKGEVGMLKMFADEIIQDASHHIPAGDHLTMTFTDIKYAGNFPLMASGIDDRRLIRSIFPPHYEFSYQVTDASGQVVKQGNENITDMDFQLKMSRADDPGPLRVDRDEMEDWTLKNLRNLR